MDKFLFIFLFMTQVGCLGPFKKPPTPELMPMKEKFIPPLIETQWRQISRYYSDKQIVKELLGNPDFIDMHKTGEDWYYSYNRSTNNAIISFPSSGYLKDKIQYIKYPEWKKSY